jgi:cytochrome c oxidase cbb3-type subunit 1
VLDPVRGTFQAVVNAWFTGNFVGLWLAPIALAAIFYFLPKLTGQPLYSRQLAIFGFWTLAFFTAWSGLAGLGGGPVPRWMPAVSIAANVCLLLPLLCHGINWHLTNAGNCDAWRKNVVLRFILLGAACFLLHGLVSIVLALPEVSAVTNLTYATVARNYLAILGFVGCVLFGCIYYIVPRITQVDWPNAKWIQLHLLSTALGVGLLIIALGFGGVFQGAKLARSNEPFIDVVRGTVPFVGMSTLAWLILLAGQAALLANFFGLLRQFCQPFMATTCELCGCVPAPGVDTKAEAKA